VQTVRQTNQQEEVVSDYDKISYIGFRLWYFYYKKKGQTWQPEENTDRLVRQIDQMIEGLTVTRFILKTIQWRFKL